MSSYPIEILLLYILLDLKIIQGSINGMSRDFMLNATAGGWANSLECLVTQSDNGRLWVKGGITSKR